MPTLAWLGLFLSLNQTAPIKTPFLQPGFAAEATAVVGVGKLTVTAIYIEPLQKQSPRLLSIGVGIRVF
jgi:hypothetical protein